MAAMPKGLTATTGIDALNHAIKAYVSTAATPITDVCPLKAVELISANLRTAVANGSDMPARKHGVRAVLGSDGVTQATWVAEVPIVQNDQSEHVHCPLHAALKIPPR